METGSTSSHPIVPVRKSPVVLCSKNQRTSELPRAHRGGSARSQTSMAIVARTPTCGIEDLLSSAMEIGADFGYTVRLSATMLAAVTRSAGMAASRHGDRPGTGAHRVKVELEWPFTSGQQHSPTYICISSNKVVQTIAALEAALGCLSDVALGTPNLDLSALALSSSGPRIGRRKTVDVEIMAMKEVVRAYTVGGGVWPGTGLRMVRLSIPKPLLMARVLVYLRHCGEGGRAVLDALAEHVVVGSPSAIAPVLLLCESAETDATPARLEEASTSIVSKKSEVPVPASRLETVSDNEGRSRDGIPAWPFAEPEDESHPAAQSTRDAAADLRSEESSAQRQHRIDATTPPVNGSTPTPSSGGGPQVTFSTAASPESGVVPPAAMDISPPPRSSSPSMSLRLERKGGRCQVGVAGKGAGEPGSTMSPSPTQRRRRPPVPPRSPVHSGGGGSKLTLDTAAAATTSRRRSAAGTPPSTADAVGTKLPSSASPGRRRVSSSPRGRPSGSPGRRSRSPAESRDSTIAGSPRASQPKVSKGNLATAENSLLFRPPPPDLQQSCYHNMGGLPDFLGDNSRVGGAFWGRGSVRCSGSIHHMMAMKAMLSPTVKNPTPDETDKPEVSSTSSPSALEQEQEANAMQNNGKAKEEEEEEAKAATAAADRKAARRVTWAPIVIARDEAAAVIRPFMQRYAEAEVQECRVAHSDWETMKFVERRAKRERGQGRRPAIARPAAQRGAFFGLLSGLSEYRSTWRKYQDFVIMENTVTPFIPPGLTRNQLAAWGIGSGGGGSGSGCAMAGKQASGASAPPGPANLGEAVRKMATDLLNGGA